MAAAFSTAASRAGFTATSGLWSVTLSGSSIIVAQFGYLPVIRRVTADSPPVSMVAASPATDSLAVLKREVGVRVHRVSHSAGSVTESAMLAVATVRARQTVCIW